MGSDFDGCLAVIDGIVAVGKCDTEIDTVDDVRRYVDLESLCQSAPLVCKAYDDALAVHGRERCEREHMLCDDVLLDVVKLKISAGIGGCYRCVCETVETSGLILDVPVVKEVIVKERAAYEAVLINFDLKCLLEEICDEEAELRNGYAMFENRSLSVLGKLLHGLRFRT